MYHMSYSLYVRYVFEDFYRYILQLSCDILCAILLVSFYAFWVIVSESIDCRVFMQW